MPNLTDTQGGDVAINSPAHITSEKSWVTIQPGPPVVIFGEAKVVEETLWGFADVRFFGGTSTPTIINPVNLTACYNRGIRDGLPDHTGRWSMEAVLKVASSWTLKRSYVSGQVVPMIVLVRFVNQATLMYFDFDTKNGETEWMNPADGATQRIEFWYTP